MRQVGSNTSDLTELMGGLLRVYVATPDSPDSVMDDGRLSASDRVRPRGGGPHKPRLILLEQPPGSPVCALVADAQGVGNGSNAIVLHLQSPLAAACQALG